MDKIIEVGKFPKMTNQKINQFSVLLSIYSKEKSEYFERAMQSIWDEQTIKPDEIVLVQDGVLNDCLDASIDKWQNKLGMRFKTITIEKRAGLGDALNIGLQDCRNELVARMDTDDIAMPLRFEKLLKMFKHNQIDICSSWISEFDQDENKTLNYRKVPESHTKIVQYSKLRNPINHPSVMFKKSSVLDAGGYQHMPGFEDYYLWARMIKKGAHFANIPEALVKMRAGYSQLERRRGFEYAFNEIKFQNALYALGIINVFEYSRNGLIRFISRIMPKSILKNIYQVIRTK